MLKEYYKGMIDLFESKKSKRNNFDFCRKEHCHASMNFTKIGIARHFREFSFLHKIKGEVPI